jgi:GT2 family glycosyltransferase
MQTENDNRTLVSVIMATRDRHALLRDALASVVAQHHPYWELLLVNDGGTSVDEIARSADPLGRIRVINHRVSFGPAAARNAALRQARGAIVCYLDDDDLYRPHHLSTVVRAFADTKTDFVYTDSERVIEELRSGERIVLGRDRPFSRPAYSRDQLLVTNYIPLNAWAHRWELVQRAGVFDEQLPFLEDWELLLRFVRHGSVTRVAEMTVEVRHRADRRDSRTGQGSPLAVETYREIYRRSDDLCGAAVRAERDQCLDFLRRQSPTQSPAPTGGTAGETNVKESFDYERWLQKHSLREIDAEAMAERMVRTWSSRPLVHLFLRTEPGAETRLAATFNGLSRQLYDHWCLTVVSEAVAPANFPSAPGKLEWARVAAGQGAVDGINALIAQSTADWVGLLDAGDMLEPHALLAFGDYLHRQPQWRLIYPDEDHLWLNGERRDPRFKPDFNLDLLRSQAYVGSFALTRRDVLVAAGGFGRDSGTDIYDLTLRVLDLCGEESIGHIPAVLFQRHETNEARVSEGARESAGKAAVTAHLARHGIDAHVTDGVLPGTWRVRYEHATTPFVSLVIVTRDQTTLLADCIDSVFGKTSYANCEVVLVDGASRAEDTFDFYQSLQTRYPGRVRVVSSHNAGNYSAMVNEGALAAQGEYLLLLAPDTQVLQGDWLERLLSHGQRPEVGIVGARLVSADQRVQHAGVVLGMGNLGVAGHVHAGLALGEAGYLGRAQVDQNYSAVSGACLLIRKSVFAEAGAMDERELTQSFSAVDLCLRAGARGYKIVWTPYVTLVHHSRFQLEPDVSADEHRQRFDAERHAMYERWLARLAHDPAYNRNLSLQHTTPQPEGELDVSWDVSFHERPRVLAVPLDVLGVGQHRAIAPLRALEHAGHAHVAFTPCSDLQARPRMPSVAELERLKPDTLYLQSTLHDVHLERLKQYKRFNQVFKVFDFEDLKTDVPDKNSRKRILFPELKRRLREVLASCDRMTVTTQPLYEAYRHLISDIRIVPLRLERARWGNLVSKRRQSARPRVGWAGAQQHHADLELMIPVVQATANEVDWVFFGMCLDELRPYVKEVHPFVPYEQYAPKLVSLNLDLAVAPLEYHPFNEAKTNLRLLEYGVMGWPVVCTDIYPYHDAPAKRVPNQPQAWIEAIRERAHDLDAAGREGDQMRAWVLRHFILEDHLDEWLDALGLSNVSQTLPYKTSITA